MTGVAGRRIKANMLGLVASLELLEDRGKKKKKVAKEEPLVAPPTEEDTQG